MLKDFDTSSTRPYLLRALHEWCTDNGLTPYVTVMVDETVQVPMEHVKKGEIVLNVSYDATAGMTLGNEFIQFKARFGGKPREIMIPVNRVMAIYARENGQGMSFPIETHTSVKSETPNSSTRTFLSTIFAAIEGPNNSENSNDKPPTPPTPPTPPSRPMLKRVK